MDDKDLNIEIVEIESGDKDQIVNLLTCGYS